MTSVPGDPSPIPALISAAAPGDTAHPRPHPRAGRTDNTITGGTMGTSVQAGAIGSITITTVAPQPALVPPVPCQLWPLSASFTDRVADLRRLVRWLPVRPSSAVQIIALHGDGGVGKSALSNRLLHQVRDSYARGVLSVHLGAHAATGPTSTKDALARLVRSLWAGPVPADVEELTAWWRSITARRPDEPVAVLLDDVVDAAQVRALLPGGAGHLVVATSRAPLADLARDGALLHPIEPLGAEDALEYLSRCLGHDRIAHEAQAARQLTDLSGGLPLALGLTAARLAAAPDRSLTDMLTTLADAHRQPPEQTEADTQEMAVTSALDAHKDLPPETARVYRLLSLVFTDDVDAGLTAAVCDIPAGQAVQELQRLHAANLLEYLGQQAGRDNVYRFHDRVRTHARGLAAAEEPHETEAEVTRRAIDWYLLTTTVCERLITPAHGVLDRDTAFPVVAAPLADEETALSWLDTQHTNLMTAVRTAHQAGLYSSTWQLVHAMWPWWHRVHDYGAWFEAHELAYEAAWRCGHRPAQRVTLNTWGVGLRSNRQPDRALEVFEQVHALAVEDDDQLSASQALHEIGNVHLDSGRLDDAERILQQAREMRAALGYQRGVALTDICLGRVAYDTQDYTRAVNLFYAAYDALKDEHRFNAARALAWLGLSHPPADDFDAAGRCLRQANQAFATAGSPRWTARSLEMLGDVMALQGRTADARDHYRQALALYEPISAPDADRVTASLNALG